jgi:NAD(P)-dependent dehydrogenase (short-subunit alcohol dehydrogenase family)
MTTGHTASVTGASHRIGVATAQAQVNYTMSAAAELAPFGVTASMVHPPVTGSVLTLR